MPYDSIDVKRIINISQYISARFDLSRVTSSITPLLQHVKQYTSAIFDLSRVTSSITPLLQHVNQYTSARFDLSHVTSLITPLLQHVKTNELTLYRNMVTDHIKCITYHQCNVVLLP